MDEHVNVIERVVEWLRSDEEHSLDPSEARHKAEYEGGHKWLDENDFKLLGSGETRETYSIPDTDCVVKLARHTTIQNRIEINTWNMAEESEVDAETLLAPIVRYDENHHDWLIMREVDTIGLMDEDWEKVEQNMDYDTIESWGIDTSELEYGWYNDNIVAYDYGQMEESVTNG